MSSIVVRLRSLPMGPLVLAVTLLTAGCGSKAPTDQASPADALPPPASTAAAVPAAAPAAFTGEPVSKADIAKDVCYYAPEELSTALGFKVEAGKADTTRTETSGNASCTYSGSKSDVRLDAYWIDPGLVGAARQGMTMLSGGGGIEVLPGDPDNAYFHDQQDNGTSLHYLRRNVRIQIQITSGSIPFARAKSTLLTLRRVP